VSLRLAVVVVAAVGVTERKEFGKAVKNDRRKNEANGTASPLALFPSYDIARLPA
jgi:hypothetical protein